ncbi:hypothetical protein A1O1_01314 [Capronia coronata CBS 617.96]|uniref:Uncharacterized protein n=1 Tax=Capronia coronata CBS 617.96 TaxID=1182541 RepID=W9YUI4_9EURO|nr:uncharacterized protein A1O1_01314 [Capronia coronata CBS 617.96]EXJ96188.1 hypothetical protein A1O1_01314 [Capronia coronata CBS 617.96]
MTWLKGAFACCSAHDRLEADTRHARIVAVTNDYHYNGRRAQSHHHHYDNPPAYQDITPRPLIPIDEKDSAYLITDAHESLRPSSPHSSVVSVPSTRVTDLTALPTGDTAVTFTSTRGSLEGAVNRESRPPSYYSTLRRSPTPNLIASDGGLAEEDGRDEVWQHPVMRSDWLGVLRRDARRHAASSEAYGEHVAHDARPADQT